MDTDTKKIQQQIGASRLLKPAQSTAMLQHLDTFSPEQLARLGTILATEAEALSPNPAERIAAAAASGDVPFFEGLDALIYGESRKIRKAEETAERGDEQGATDRLFDDTPTPDAAR